MSSSFSWGIAVAQLANATRVERKEPKFNPRPAGVIQAGSATAAVLQILRANPKTYYTSGRLLELTGRTHAAVSWSLIFLRKQGLVKTIEDGSRNPRWMRYAADVGAKDVEIAEQPRKKAGKERLGGDVAPVHGHQAQGPSPVWSEGNHGRAALDGLPDVSGGHGPAPQPESLARAQERAGQLRAEQLPLDDARRTGEAPRLLYQGQAELPGIDSGRGGPGAPDRTAQVALAPQGWIAAASDCGDGRQAHAQERDSCDPCRRDHDPQPVGAAHRNAARLDRQTPESWLAGRSSLTSKAPQRDASVPIRESEQPEIPRAIAA